MRSFWDGGGFPLVAVVIGIAIAFYRGGSRLRDPRLDRDYSDDEPAPYDSPSTLSPRMDQYMRMLDDESPPRF